MEMFDQERKSIQPVRPPPVTPLPPDTFPPTSLKLCSRRSTTSSSSSFEAFGQLGLNHLLPKSDVQIHSTPITTVDEYENENSVCCQNLNYIPPHMGCVSEEDVLEDDEKPYNRHCQVAPLVQVFSVRLDTHFKDKTPCCIYGKINVIEVGDGTTFTLYERETHDPEVLQKNNAILSLTGPMLGESPGVISQSRGGAIMQLALRDSVRDVEVVGGQCSLGSIIEYEDHHYDKLRTAVLKCLHGCAKVYYATVLYGVMSKIQLKFLIDGDYGRDLPSDLHLIVTAHYGNSKLYPTHNEDSNYFEMLLLKRPLHGLEKTNTSELICQHAVVVPAYSSLIVEANLVSSSGKGFCGSVEFPATYHGCYVHKIRVLNGLVRVQVAWDFINPYHRLCQGRSVWGSSIPAVPEPVVFCDYLAEVFSIRICGTNYNVRSVSGSIVIDDAADDPYFLFQSDERGTSESVLLGDGSLLLSGPNRIAPNADFCLRTDIKDPMRGREISIGGMQWNLHSLENISRFSWYDKRICSVIKGKDGCAVVHHTIFYDAVQATVEAKMYFNGGADVAAFVHGSIVVRYGAYEYLTSYEKKYFKTWLYNTNKKDSTWVAKGDNIPLPRYLVAVPRNSSLIIEVDLIATSASTGFQFPEEELRGEAEFDIGSDHTSHKIEGARGVFVTEICVKWAGRLRTRNLFLEGRTKSNSNGKVIFPSS